MTRRDSRPSEAKRHKEEAGAEPARLCGSVTSGSGPLGTGRQTAPEIAVTLQSAVLLPHRHRRGAVTEAIHQLSHTGPLLASPAGTGVAEVVQREIAAGTAFRFAPRESGAYHSAVTPGHGGAAVEGGL